GEDRALDVAQLLAAVLLRPREPDPAARGEQLAEGARKAAGLALLPIGQLRQLCAQEVAQLLPERVLRRRETKGHHWSPSSPCRVSGPGYSKQPSAAKWAISSSCMPRISVRIACVCSPKSGAGRHGPGFIPSMQNDCVSTAWLPSSR